MSNENFNILSVVGARPQFVKAAVVSKALREFGFSEYLVHTGQHYDEFMSDIFFQELSIKDPPLNLSVGSGSHAYQTADMLKGIEDAIRQVKPALVLVYGDTNSTLAASLAAVKLHVPIAHVEAGARNFSLTIPEEVNRVVTDHLSALLFCVTKTNVQNLAKEGIDKGVFLVGDVMYDIFQQNKSKALERMELLSKFGLEKGNYILTTLHRPSNVDNPDTLLSILRGIISAGKKVVFPVHPRTRNVIDSVFDKISVDISGNLIMTDPVGYLDMLCFEINSYCIVTDSGGVQREAYFAGKPCLTIFENTAWVETVEEGWNRVIPPDTFPISKALNSITIPSAPRLAFGDGTASNKIASIIHQKLSDGITVDG